MYIKKLSKNGQISVPLSLKKKLGVNDGEYVYIFMEAGRLLISKHHEDDHLNKVIFRNGKFSIPAELRKMLKICPNSLLRLEIHSEKGYITIVNLDNILARGQLNVNSYPL
ncbi:AbrB/MazE/SpoVT family DNA-binding domain-containing protein [Bacillus sp. NTK034]|uniref:AbrB/MazE/SpoVT family DNA-binding domain-containing protein n=1 Tax=Bacillus sp. NTK034 TaxID=2802176 RepID=UPI001A904911|nr:AbrB/MazE/SpoVT family DNA-binding domain-containing protein [Bacillus sp. NTK034]MBN8201421.1 AbrB/MazE/SpoVT family DNA-binding domain-containing protein [Bacillus sp. NTK034]